MAEQENTEKVESTQSTQSERTERVENVPAPSETVVEKTETETREESVSSEK